MKTADLQAPDAIAEALAVLKSAELSVEQKAELAPLLKSAEPTVLVKADGSVNVEALAKMDPALRAQVEALAKGQSEQRVLLERLEKAALDDRHARDRAEFIMKAAETYRAVPGGADAVGDLLFRVSKAMPEQLPVLETLLKATQALALDLTKSVGTSSADPAGAGATAWSRIQKGAEALAVERKISKEVAIAAFLDTPEGQALYTVHDTETRGH